MSYNSIALKFRPQTFSQVKGQDLIVKIMQAAIADGSKNGAYLLCGSRGTGKTSLARIIAKALNCENLKDGEPCQKCLPCTEITKNLCPDVFEIDAASNRGIENIRSIKENINYMPQYCKTKVYIIDETHMLTNEAFNSLLKTLEEPPNDVKFILATTNPQKLPDTILSRCVRFDLQMIAHEIMVEHIKYICLSEGISLTDEMINILSEKSGGSMRDALISLETIANLKNNDLTAENIRQLMGWHDNAEILAILKTAFEKNTKSALSKLTEIFKRGTSANNLIAGFLKLIRVMIFKASNAESGTEPYLTAQINQQLTKLAGDVGLSKLHQAFDIFIDLELKSQNSTFEHWLLEMALIRISQIENITNLLDILDAIKHAPHQNIDQSPPVELNTSNTKPESTDYKLPPKNSSTNLTNNSNNKENVGSTILPYRDREHDKIANKEDISPPNRAPSLQINNTEKSLVPDNKLWIDFLDANLKKVTSINLRGILKSLRILSLNEKYLTISEQDQWLQMQNSPEADMIEKLLSDFYKKPIKIKIVNHDKSPNRSYQEIENERSKAKNQALKLRLTKSNEIKKINDIILGEIKKTTLKN